MTARRASGLTLLELMIGLALLGLIMTLAFAGLQLTGRGWDASEAAGEKVNRVRLVQALLERELEAIHPYRWKRTADTNIAFAGASDTVRFVSSHPPRAGPGGLQMVELSLVKGDQGTRLLMQRRIPDPDARDFERMDAGDSVVLLDDLQDAAFGYFGADTPQGRPSWRERWEDRQRLPRLVRVSLHPQDAPAWPDVIVRLRVDESAGCPGWDPVNERCVSMEAR